MRRARTFLAVALVLLLLGFSVNAYACLLPLFGAAGMMQSGCMDPGEESARQFCDAFKTLAVRSLPSTDLDSDVDCQTICPEDSGSLCLLLTLPTRDVLAPVHIEDTPPQDLHVKSFVLRL